MTMNTEIQAQKLLDELRLKAARAPASPGIYIMKDKEGSIIYVGKAVILQNRLRSYFSKQLDIKTRALMKRVHEIEYIITNNEFEALLLENTYIKQHKPRYNIQLKDGKSYPVICITNEEYPRVFKTRNIRENAGEYFGPYANVKMVDTYLEIIVKLFSLRKCKGKLKKREHPCLYYHMGKCLAPCCGNISKEEYNIQVDKIRKLLRGETADLNKMLKKEMREKAGEHQYEKAAELRDMIRAVEALSTQQGIVNFDPHARDYIAIESLEAHTGLGVFQLRNGNLINRELYTVDSIGGSGEILSQFIMTYYDQPSKIPLNLYITGNTRTDLLEKYFLDKRSTRLSIEILTEGPVMNMVRENIRHFLRDTYGANETALSELARILDLPRFPHRIEGFDISQLSGKYPVAAMVSFENGKPDKKNYRRFHIKTLDGMIDDYKAMSEVIARRYTRLSNEGKDMPDIILIDGGKGHVAAAHNILSALELSDIPIVGLAKREEEIFRPGESKPLYIPEGTPPLRILQQVRDEAHRFGNTFNRNLREKDLLLSHLLDIPGIGEKRAKRLLMNYKSLENIARTEAESLSEFLNIPVSHAQTVIDRLEAIL